MKNHYKFLIITLFFLTATTTNIVAQAPPPPPPSHGETGNQSGGDAPITEGLFILLSLGAAYGGKKLNDREKDKLV